MTLDLFLSTIYIPLRLRGRSPESARLLRHAVTQFSRWLGRPAMLDDLDDLIVSQWLAAMAEKKSPNSVARERSGILALWNLAQGRGLVRLRPTVAPELVPQSIPRAFTEDELAARRLRPACLGVGRPDPGRGLFPCAYGGRPGDRRADQRDSPDPAGVLAEAHADGPRGDQEGPPAGAGLRALPRGLGPRGRREPPQWADRVLVGRQRHGPPETVEDDHAQGGAR